MTPMSEETAPKTLATRSNLAYTYRLLAASVSHHRCSPLLIDYARAATF